MTDLHEIVEGLPAVLFHHSEGLNPEYPAQSTDGVLLLVPGKLDEDPVVGSVDPVFDALARKCISDVAAQALEKAPPGGGRFGRDIPAETQEYHGLRREIGGRLFHGYSGALFAEFRHLKSAPIKEGGLEMPPPRSVPTRNFPRSRAEANDSPRVVLLGWRQGSGKTSCMGRTEARGGSPADFLAASAENPHYLVNSPRRQSRRPVCFGASRGTGQLTFPYWPQRTSSDMKRLFPVDHAFMTRTLLALLVASILTLGGCATTSDDKGSASSETGSEFSDASATAGAEEAVVVVVEWQDPGMVHFDFDSSEIRPDAVAVLEAAAEQLTATGMTVVIAGYCDDRGTEEYNLALGDRRASAVRRYLANLGVPQAQMMVVSYGELRPLRRGNNDAAWAANRRVEFEPAG